MGLTSHFPLNQDYGRKHSSMEDVSPFLLLPTKVALLLWRWNSLPISEAMEREKMERQRDLFGDTKWQVNPPQVGEADADHIRTHGKALGFMSGKVWLPANHDLNEHNPTMEHSWQAKFVRFCQARLDLPKRCKHLRI